MTTFNSAYVTHHNCAFTDVLKGYLNYFEIRLCKGIVNSYYLTCYNKKFFE